MIDSINKYCSRCKKTLSIDLFSCNKKTKDNLQTWCKCCNKEYNDVYKKSDMKSKSNKKYTRTSAGKMARSKNNKKHKELNPIKHRARQLLNNAVLNGSVVKPIRCEICSNCTGVIDGHHEDYTKPLEVVWCCHKCHINTYHSGGSNGTT